MPSIPSLVVGALIVIVIIGLIVLVARKKMNFYGDQHEYEDEQREDSERLEDREDHV